LLCEWCLNEGQTLCRDYFVGSLVLR